jgi:hypothetical protein
MAQTKHQTAYWTVKAPDGLPLNHRAGPPRPGLRTHKKTGLGQSRDRRTLREFQFPE